MAAKELSDARKEQRKNNMRKSEANFLRFLRTSESAGNYNTLKIIGKGAFGEVRLVQRKHDGKIYALKSLIKTEMVCTFSLCFVRIAIGNAAAKAAAAMACVRALAYGQAAEQENLRVHRRVRRLRHDDKIDRRHPYLRRSRIIPLRRR